MTPILELYVDGKKVDFSKAKLIYTEPAHKSFTGDHVPASSLTVNLTPTNITLRAHQGRRLVREESEKLSSELDRMLSWH